MSKLIPLTKGQFAIVDDEDYDLLMQWKWYLTSDGYAARNEYTPENKTPRTVLMHRVITMAPKNMDVDHHDTNRLNNCRSNLRIATRSQNCRNSRKARNKSSQYKGVTWSSRLGKWMAQLNSKTTGKIHLGTFALETDAAQAYDAAARRYYGDYARTNF